MNSPPELPEDIEVDIMEKLFQGSTVKEAVRASVVSRRYKKLWTNVWNSLTRLDFEECFHGTNNDLQSRYKFMEFVSHSLVLHQGIAVDSLRIAFDTNDNMSDDAVEKRLANWVRFARNKCVRSLELNLNLNPSCVKPKKGFGFPMDEFRLGLSTLTSLSLNSINITTQVVLYLLESCLINLETLVIENAPEVSGVIAITAPKLKHLEIRLEIDSVCVIYIVSAPSLECIKCLIAYSVYVRFNHVLPKLSNISLGGLLCQDQMLHLQQHAPNLEKLELLFGFICQIHSRCSANTYPRDFGELGNVKHLGLEFSPEANNIMDLMFVVTACPNLQNLTLKCIDSRNYGRTFGQTENHWEQTSYKHLSLKVIEFVGWMGRKCDVQFANCLVDSAVILEKVTFDLNTLPTRSCQIQNEKMEQAAVLGAQQVIGCRSNLIAHQIVLSGY